MQDYTKFDIWKEAIEIGLLAYKICEGYPKI